MGGGGTPQGRTEEEWVHSMEETPPPHSLLVLLLVFASTTTSTFLSPPASLIFLPWLLQNGGSSTPRCGSAIFFVGLLPRIPSPSQHQYHHCAARLAIYSEGLPVGHLVRCPPPKRAWFPLAATETRKKK
eukprot:RCo035379